MKRRGKVEFVTPSCSGCQGGRPIHPKRFLLELQAFTDLGIKWLCHKCRRKAGIDVRPACRRLKKQKEWRRASSKGIRRLIAWAAQKPDP